MLVLLLGCRCGGVALMAFEGFWSTWMVPMTFKIGWMCLFALTALAGLALEEHRNFIDPVLALTSSSPT
jgi:hypothetical protein